MHINFPYPNFSETLESFPRKFLALWVYKTIQQKLVVTPSWAGEVSDTRIFLTQRLVPPGIFPALWDEKNFNKNKWHPFLMHKICRYPIMSETLNSYPKKFSALWDFKKVQRKLVISISYAWKFSIPEVSRNIEEYPTKISGTVSQTNWRKNGTTPIFYQ